MTDPIELRASLNSLKRVDPYVKNILATATQVALYKFNIDNNIWEKADKEGALFLYSRNGEPLHSLMIFNRLNKDNFIEPIINDFDYQVQIPFLLYRSKSKIFGIWFFNRDECIRVATLIESLMDKDKVFDDRSLPQGMPPQNGGNEDIFSMLSKAQNDFTRTPSKPENKSTSIASASTPRALDIASQSVIDFFAKASTKGGSTRKPVATSSGGNVLHRLMSNPAHSVEHIEKQQRSITPQELTGGEADNVLYRLISKSNPAHNVEHLEKQQRSISPQDLIGSRSENVLHRLMSNAAAHSVEHIEKQQRSITPQGLMGTDRSLPINLPNTSGNLKKFEVFDHQPNGLNIPGISPPKQTIATSPLAYLMQNQPSSVKTDDSIESGTSPFQKFLENAHKPHLMTPMMFSSAEDSKSLEVLTEKQLAQALIYLLKNDTDFVKKIHQAYINSILEKVDKP